MDFTKNQLKVISLLTNKHCSLLYVLHNNKVKYYLLDDNLRKIETVRKDNAEKILKYLNLPVTIKSKNRILFTFRKNVNKNLDLEQIHIFNDKLSNRTIHSIIWNKRGEFGANNVRLVYSIEEIDAVTDIFQEFSEYVTVERLFVVSGKNDVVLLTQIPHYSLDYPEVEDLLIFDIGGKRVECSSEMKNSLELAKEKLNYFKGLRFEYIEKRIKEEDEDY